MGWRRKPDLGARVDAGLHDRESKLLEPRRLALGELQTGEVDQRRSTPEREGVVVVGQSGQVIVSHRQRAAMGGQLFEPACING
jgi:hypothetical protein